MPYKISDRGRDSQSPASALSELEEELRKIPASLCIRCKGAKLLCGKSSCPIISKVYLSRGVLTVLNEAEGNSPPSIFVGHYGYPKVRIGPAVPLERGDTTIYERPDLWRALSVEEIARLRFSLYRGYKTLPVTIPSDPNSYLLEVHDLILSSRPVFSELEFSSLDKRVDLSPESQPFGPGGYVKNFYHESSPSLPIVEKVYYDTDLKASEALTILHSKTSIYNIQKLFSAGMLGITRKRKLVPTRWAITAVDNTISNSILSQIKEFEEIDGNLFFHSKRIGNEYYILIIPGSYSFEMIENWNNGSIWTGPRDGVVEGDYEKPGRMVQNPNIGGAFFAAKLPILEYLSNRGAKGSILVIRFVDGDYTMPLGVWQVRENVKLALESGTYIDGIDTFFDAIKARRMTDMRKYSKTYQTLKLQRKITEYVS